MLRPIRAILALAALASPLVAAVQAPCAVWSDDYGAPGFDNAIVDSLVYDDGSGPALYVTGLFTRAPDGSSVSGVARRTSTGWSQVGTLPATTVNGGLAALDVGSGPQLFAHGYKVSTGAYVGVVHRLDGAQWTQVGSTLGSQSGDGSSVTALVVFDHGSGPMLYAGGSFSGGVVSWNGTAWSGIGGGLFTGPFDHAPFVSGLAVHDDGSSSALYAAGLFDRTASSGPLSLRNIVRWSGSRTWSPVGEGLGDVWNNIPVYQLTSFPTPAGRRLAASVYGNVVVWDGASWMGLSPTPGNTPTLQAFEGGAGLAPGLLAAGEFTMLGSLAVPGRAHWDGSTWTSLGAATGSGGRSTFTLYDGGSGERLHAAHVGGVVESLEGDTWTSLGPGGLGASTTVDGLSVLPGPDGRANLYAFGSFRYIGGIGTDGFARYDGFDWHREQPPEGFTGVTFFAVDLGGGPVLHATGTNYPYPPGTPVRRILRRDGSSWTLLPTLPVVSEGPFDPTAYDDGTGLKLFVGSATGVWRLDGASWTRVVTSNAPVVQLFAFDDGTGEALYLEGNFTTLDGVPCNQLARWDGATVTPLGGGGYGVRVLAAHDFGSGPELVAGGSFTSLGGVPCQRIARWEGTQWAAIGAGMTGAGNVWVSQLVSLDDGTGNGSQLVAGGWFTAADGLPAAGLARWTGAAWESIGAGLGGSSGPALVNGLAAYDAGDGRGEALFVGGTFDTAGGANSRHLARWESCGGDAQTFCYGDGSATPCPCLNSSLPEERAGCRSSLGVGGTLRVHGRASLSADSLRIEGTSMPNSSALYFQGAGVVAGGAGVPFGDGLNCTSGPFIRFATKSNVGGASVYPSALDLPVSIRGAISAPGTRYYQVRYRNAAAFCAPETFNYTNGVSVVWGG